MVPHLEIERKFLLKRIPDLIFDDCLEIEQYYIDKGNYRVRKSINLSLTPFFTLTKKKFVSNGVYEEDEHNISEKEFKKHKKKANLYLCKDRWLKKSKGLKWEIDCFKTVNLVVAEIELPSQNYKLKLPKFITNNLIMEVTNFREFTNKKLALKI